MPPDFQKYLMFSRRVREIFGSYTDQVEPFGLDEAWLDVTGSVIVRGYGEFIANEIRQRVKDELGNGVADNKIFAKLGSDMKKPDATTIIIRQNFKEKVWILPAEDLLYVGHYTSSQITSFGTLLVPYLTDLSQLTKLLHLYPALSLEQLAKSHYVLHRQACLSIFLNSNVFSNHI
jgi:nucleotidyltransferase/DNA polymerase involved in DNA repair